MTSHSASPRRPASPTTHRPLPVVDDSIASTAVIDTPISVLMTVRNGARHLDVAVESLLRQSFRNIQIVVVDDASTDRTPEILNSTRDSRLELVRSDIPLGIAAAKTIGLERCVGKYIAMMDADDVAVPTRLAVQKRYLDERPAIGLVGSNVVVVDDVGKPLGIRVLPKGSPTVRWKLLIGPPFVHPSVMIRRELLGSTSYRSDYEFAQDYDLWSRLLCLAEGANISRPLLLYRSHPGQHSQEARTAQLAEHDVIAPRVVMQHLPDLDLPAAVVRRMWRFMSGVAQDDMALGQLGVAYLRMARAFLNKHEGTAEISEVRNDVAMSVIRRFGPHLQQDDARAIFRELARMDSLAPIRCAGVIGSAVGVGIHSIRAVRLTRRRARSPW